MQEHIIVSIVCEKLAIEREHVFKKTRKRESVYARQISILMMLFFTEKSHFTIGTYFQLRDHTSVNHARKTVADLMDSDENVYETVSSIFQTLRKHEQLTLMPDRRNKIEANLLYRLLHSESV